MSRFSTGVLASAFLLPAAVLPAGAQAQDASDEDVIVVTASPLNRSVDESITGLSILTGDDLEDRLEATIGETLKLEPGVSSTSFGAGASRPIIRGQGGDRVRVLLNGIGSIDASSASPDHAVAAEPAQAERIEVLRGASILRFGSSGSGGIVNINDGRIPSEFPDGNTDVAIRFGASSVDIGKEAAASIDQRVGDFVIHVDGTFRDANNFRIPVFPESEVQLEAEGEEIPEDFDDNQVLDNSFAESGSITGGVSYIGESGFIGIAVHNFTSTYGIPGGHEEGEEEEGEGGEEEEEEEGDVFIDLDQTRIDLNAGWDFEGPIERVQAFAGYADYEHIEFEGPGEVGTVFSNEGFEIRAEAIQAARGTWKAAYGVQYRERDFSAIGEEAFVPPTVTEQLGVYTFQEVELGNAHLEAAGRYERTDQENSVSGEDVSFDLFSVSAGGNLFLTDAFRIGANVFRTERAPTTEELFSDGPHLATSQFEIGDPTLDEEVALGVEASARYADESRSASVNVFYTDYTDYIYEIETDGVEDGLPIFQFVGEDTEFYGFEAVGETDLVKFGSFDLSADSLVEFVRATGESGDIPRIPPLSVLSGLEAESERFKLRAEWEYVSEANDLAAFELPTDSYNQINGFLTWKAPVESTDVQLRLSVLNLFNVEARQHSSFLKDVVPLPGRNVRFSISAKL